MIHKYFYLLFFQILFLNGQQVKVEYFHVRSPIANLKEKLYIKNHNSFSIQDSIINIENDDTGIFEEKNLKFSPQFLLKNSNDLELRDFTFIDTISEENDLIFSVHDNNATQIWKIDYTTSKKILDYVCYKAETEFRGRKFIAYFTKQLPYKTGPYKFNGLPGLILEIYALNIPHYRWKAVAIDLNNNEKIDFEPIYKNLNRIDLKNFVRLQDEKRKAFSMKIDSSINLPPGVHSESISERLGIEKIYEWENK